MSRIRSIHPGLFTDEEYMALSFAARELVKGLWVEADDQGVFEWKLLTIKARIMPADSVDMSALMGELVEHRFLTQFDCDGKKYGAIRNFRTFQRPKKPSEIHPLPEHLREYVGLIDEDSGHSSPPVPHQFTTSGVNPPQMEDGGGRKDKEEVEKEEREEPRKRGSRIPEGAILPDEYRAFAEQEGHSDPEREWAKFTDYWRAQPGQKGVKLDWLGTWRNWVRRSVENGRSNQSSARGADFKNGFAAVLAGMA